MYLNRNTPDLDGTSSVPPDEEAIVTPDLEAVAEILVQAAHTVEVPPGFARTLETQILAKASAQQRPAGGKRAFFAWLPRRRAWTLAGTFALTVLLLLILPLLRVRAPSGGNIAATTPGRAKGSASSATPQATSDQEPALRVLLAFFGSLAEAAEPTGAFGRAELAVGGQLPVSPVDALVYEQRSTEEMTPARARELAAKLGIQGEVYQTPSEAVGETIYHVTDGRQQVWFIRGSAFFSYEADMPRGPSSSAGALPLERRAQIAETFLNERGLLAFDYRVDEALSQGNRVVFDCLLDGTPLLEQNPQNPRTAVEVDGAGQVAWLSYNLNPMEPLDSYPIRSAEDAWRIVLTDANDRRVMYSISDPPMSIPPIHPVWTRRYPDEERVDLYGYLNVMKSAEPGREPWVSLNGFRLRGDLSSLIAANEGPQELSEAQKQMVASGEVSEKKAIGWARFFHIWGQITTEGNGARVMRVEGWERSLMPDDYFFGTIQRENGTRLFAAEDGRRWTLPDLPTDVPEGTPVSVRGVRLTDGPGVLDWSLIQVEAEPRSAPTGEGGGGGGGGGGRGGGGGAVEGGGPFGFSPTPGQSENQAAPTPRPLPYQPGDRLESVLGTLEVVEKRVSSDGTTDMRFAMGLPMLDDPRDVRLVELTGSALEGMLELNKLHLRVWGVYRITDGVPTIDVDRYEKAFPDEVVQAWMGRQEVATLGGRRVLLFTDTSGNQYVMSSSFGFASEDLEDDLRGEQFVVEGIVSRDTYAGYPVIDPSIAFIAPGRSDLSGYQLQSNRVGVTKVEDGPEPSGTLGDVIIDRVELAYFAFDVSQGTLDLARSPMRFVQPVWVFHGKLADGRQVQVLVQAVVDEYLR